MRTSRTRNRIYTKPNEAKVHFTPPLLTNVNSFVFNVLSPYKLRAIVRVCVVFRYKGSKKQQKQQIFRKEYKSAISRFALRKA